jgi:hypothetical protein
LDALSKRLSDDLRQHIKSLGSFPVPPLALRDRFMMP